MITKYNDNELLYLISENDEDAFEILCEKYRPLIINRLLRFKIKDNNFEDFFQECLMLLHKCAVRYREDKSFTFNIYFDISLQQHIRNLLRKESKYFYGVSLLDIETIDYLCSDKAMPEAEPDEEELLFHISDRHDKQIFRKYLDGNKIRSIADEYGCNYQKIYYIINKYRLVRPKRETTCRWGLFSRLEGQVYGLYRRKLRPREIAAVMQCEVEVVYNALKRVRAKIKGTKNN